MEKETKGKDRLTTDATKLTDPLAGIYKAYENSLTGISAINRQIDLFSSKVNLLSNSLSTDYIVGGMAKINNSFDHIRFLATSLPQTAITSPALDSIRASSLSISKLIEPTNITGLSKTVEIQNSWMKDFASKSLTVHDDYKDILGKILPSPLLPSSAYNLSSGISKLHELKTIDKGLVNQFGVQANFAKVTELNLYAEKSLSSLNWNEIGLGMGLAKPYQTAISDGLLLTTNSYKDLFKTFETTPRTILDIKPTVFRDIPTQLFNTANFLESITIEEKEEIEEEELKTDIIYENEIGLSYYLNKLDSNLYYMWLGAKKALESRNPDRVRHFSISIRELITHVLNTLAPNNEVKKWSTSEEHLHEGKPTRKARILYICREIKTENFEKYVNADVNSMIEFINLFQEGSHAIKASFTEKQLIAMRTKAESTLKFLLEIADK